MNFLDQIGAEAYLSVNVGSGTPKEASEWLEYLTTALPTTLAKERDANGHPAPYKVAFLGIGNDFRRPARLSRRTPAASILSSRPLKTTADPGCQVRIRYNKQICKVWKAIVKLRRLLRSSRYRSQIMFSRR